MVLNDTPCRSRCSTAETGFQARYPIAHIIHIPGIRRLFHLGCGLPKTFCADRRGGIFDRVGLPGRSSSIPALHKILQSLNQGPNKTLY
jgi:hypothetical protein